MREVTMQVVFKLDGEAADAEVRDIEHRLYRAARRSLIFANETVSVGKIMDRKVEEKS